MMIHFFKLLKWIFRIFILTVVIYFIATVIAKQLQNHKFSKVKIGYTEQQVIDILGLPKLVESEDSKKAMIYEVGELVYQSDMPMVILEGGKVTKVYK